MKKLFITMLFAFGFIATSSAQDKGDVEFGVNVGFNLSNVSSRYFSSERRIGYNAGLAADYYFSNRWSIKGKLIYDQKGWSEGYIANEFGTYKTDYNLNYLTVPVMANWHFGSKRNWYLNFGPYAGFILNANETAFNTNVKEYFTSTDFGIALGIGVKIPVSDKLKFSIEYEEQSGLSEIFKNSDNGRVTGNRGALNVGLNFMMK